MPSKQKLTSIRVAGVAIGEVEGRLYSLNDLEKAAVAAGVTKDIRPNEWLAVRSAQELVEVLITENSAVSPLQVKAGRYGGTYACKELVYAYAMWISPRFHLHVIRTFDALAAGQLSAVEARQARERARLEAPALTDAITYSRAAQGKPVAHYHFSNEFDLINRIALGRPSRVYRAENGISADAPIRDHLTPCQIKCVEHLQRANATLIEVGMPFESRKEQLSKLYIQRHKRGLLGELMRMEA
jgi:hypothetical protein